MADGSRSVGRRKLGSNLGLGSGLGAGAGPSARARKGFNPFKDADPRFSLAGEPDDRTPAPIETNPNKAPSGKKRPRIAFTGEEFGYGYQATGLLLDWARDPHKWDGTVPDAGMRGYYGYAEREYEDASRNNKFDYAASIPQPLRTKEQALMAVKQGTADFAVIPFYNPYAGYDFEALRALASLYTVRGVAQVEATDKLCLAVHESQLYDLVQSSHPGTGFSSLQRRFRKSWGVIDSGSGNRPGAEGMDAEMPRAGLPIDMADQKLIRDRIDMVFAGPEAARRCKSRLDGMRAIGITVEEIPQMVEPHRELARRARQTLNGSRQTNTVFNPISGETQFFSTLGAEAQSGSLFGMVLPYEVAMRSSDYIIVDHDFDDAPAEKTRFMVVEENLDHTLVEDAYRTTDARTRYWMNRLRAVAAGTPNMAANILNAAAPVLFLASLVFLVAGVSGLLGRPLLPMIEAPEWLVFGGNSGAAAIGAGLFVAALVSLFGARVEAAAPSGVRVMFKFRRDGAAASIGDVEDFLRNFGVRHAVTRLDEDSERSKPASVMLDIEFTPEDFRHDIFTMLTRRFRGSVVNGAVKKAFQRWKNRGVLVLAAMPIQESYQWQLPEQQPRHWWSQGLGAWLYDVGETWFIRLSRLLFYILPALAAAYFVWRLIGGGK
ncbi:MAG: hypothetical protein R3C60_06015 [Parvularculaceae bacterium]